MTTSPMLLDASIAAFLAHQRSLGRGYNHVAYILDRLCRFVRHTGANDLDRAVFERWCEAERHLAANTRLGRQLAVRKFCRYRQRSEPRCFVPDRLSFARRQPYQAPVLVTPEQVALLLHRAITLPPTPTSPLRGPVLRTAIVLLYTAGLRRGEVIRLTLDDLEVETGVIRIRESKFHKSRTVPLSASARTELRRFRCQRLALPGDWGATSPLLCNRHGAGWRPYTGAGLAQAIRRLFKEAGVHDPEGRVPRIHDLRHSFAVHALLRLYRQGADVQVSLPKLSLYMGHVSIVSTASYLHFIPTIAALASRRFERRFAHLLGGAA